MENTFFKYACFYLDHAGRYLKLLGMKLFKVENRPLPYCSKSQNKPGLKIRRLFTLLILLFLAGGCGQPVKNSWTNFRAYYNTYYNAKKNFESGLKKVQSQDLQIDPSQPVRIHKAPVKAGTQDFQKAIDKCAKILRKFPESKWADDAILLMGKSYYYQGKYFSALQKFDELGNVTNTAKKGAASIIWKGRTLLDLKKYSEGIGFLQTELDSYPQNWPVQAKAEIRTLLAEHNVMLKNWKQAQQSLSKSLSIMESGKLRGRSLFLYGQITDHRKQFGVAASVFNSVKDNFVNFEYAYWSRMKRADAARKLGEYEPAIAIYKKIRADDKNVSRMGSINYEIARTLEMEGNIEEAQNSYEELLNENKNNNLRDLKADIYFRLGIINSTYKNNFRRAAAYFDSSNTAGSRGNNLDAQDSEMKAQAFSEFVELKNEINRADSLLRLGSMPVAKLDSVIRTIEQQRREKIADQKEMSAESRIANKNLTDEDKTEQPSGEYGFLNYQNDRFVQRGISEFQLRWGRRPLVDNWRRVEAVRSEVSDREDISATKENSRVGIRPTRQGGNLVSTADVPQTEEEKQRLRHKASGAQYQLGNLFFFKLNMADSARSYYRKVVKEGSAEELRSRAMYSLHELEASAENPDSVRYWRERILDEFPRSKYARKIQQGSSSGSSEFNSRDSVQVLRERYQQLLQSGGDSGRAGKLRKLALVNKNSELAPYIYFQSVREYINRAKKNEQNSPGAVDFLQSDSLDILSFDANNDLFSDGAQQNYEGTHWDSVRFALRQYDSTFTNTNQQQRVRELLEYLNANQKRSTIKSCKEAGTELRIAPSRESFLSSVEYPKKLRGKTLSGSVVYQFTVAKDGTVESYELKSNRTSLGIEDALEEAFDESLRFHPFPDSMEAEKLRCTVRIPIKK